MRWVPCTQRILMAYFNTGLGSELGLVVCRLSLCEYKNDSPPPPCPQFNPPPLSAASASLKLKAFLPSFLSTQHNIITLCPPTLDKPGRIRSFSSISLKLRVLCFSIHSFKLAIENQETTMKPKNRRIMVMLLLSYELFIFLLFCFWIWNTGLLFSFAF